MNKVFLIGYLAADPKARVTTKGIEQSSFSIGVTDIRNYNESYFFPCVAWNNQAKYINSNLKKGSFVSIDGKLTRRSYIDKEGKNVYITEVVVENIKSYNKPSNNIPVKDSTDDLLKDILVTNVSDVLDEPSSINESKQEETVEFDWEKDL